MSDYITDFLQRHLLPHSYLAQAKQQFQPVLENIIAQCHANKKEMNSSQQHYKPIFVGINGCQGSGKSTLADYLATKLNNQYQLNTVFFSLDDFYLSKVERQKLAHTIHPLFKTRGVPATHNIELLTQTLSTLANNQGELVIPVFDKMVDNPKPRSQWQQVNLPVDVVIIEGWCWGTQAQTEQQLLEPINGLERDFDKNGVWRGYVNQQLKHYYQPLYEYMDLSLMLKAPSFASVKQWRFEQELKLVLNEASFDENVQMDEQEIEQFIQYFQRLTEHSLATLPQQVDFCFYLNQQRKILTLAN